MAADGEIALASIGICAPVLTAITAFSSLVGIGGASVMSISIGKKDYKNARLAMNNAIILLLCLSAILTILSLIFVKPLLYALGCSDIMYLCKRIFQDLCNRHSCRTLRTGKN
ncbi:MAG: MATE family efflux transporter [Frisingicoccus sp.]